ncbi:MAG: DUF192 domain-containing protein [Parcubacteria group bacterium]|nr:DUF192 domain-containing protein [Parcubacteria group bacterium]
MSLLKKIKPLHKKVFLIAMIMVLLVGTVFFYNDSEIDEVIDSGKGLIVFVDQTVMEVEIADSRQERVHGLSGHAPLGQEEGMLFLFEEKKVAGIWMKDMLFSIDLIWLDGDLVIDLDSNLPLEDPASTIYTPSMPVDRVLEVSAGFIEEHGVIAGDRLDITLPES